MGGVQFLTTINWLNPLIPLNVAVLLAAFTDVAVASDVQLASELFALA